MDGTSAQQVAAAGYCDSEDNPISGAITVTRGSDVGTTVTPTSDTYGVHTTHARD